MSRLANALVAVAVALTLAGCAATPGPAPSTPSAAVSAAPTPSHTLAGAVDEILRAELVAMLAEDQRARTEGTFDGDDARTERLREIIAEHGWPGISLVGEDGEDAAWAIAQHSDLEPAFQAEALVLLRAAVAADDASPGNLAYLEDRVAVGAGSPQLYGTQVACGESGPEPSTPIRDEATVDERRTAAGLAPLSDYLAEMAEICALDG